MTNACLEGMLWGKFRTNLTGTVLHYVRFEFEATIVHIKMVQ